VVFAGQRASRQRLNVDDPQTGVCGEVNQSAKILHATTPAGIAGTGIDSAEVGLDALVTALLNQLLDSRGVTVRGEAGVQGASIGPHLAEDRRGGMGSREAQAVVIRNRPDSGVQEQQVDALALEAAQTAFEHHAQGSFRVGHVRLEQPDLRAQLDLVAHAKLANSAAQVGF
jgi:hypothetical protein